MSETVDYEKAAASLKESLSKTEQEISEKSELLRTLANEKSSLQSQRAVLETKIKESQAIQEEIYKLSSQLAALKMTPQELENEIAELEQKKDALSNEKSKILAIIESSEKVLDNLKPDVANCPVCGRPLQEHDISRLIEENSTLLSVNRKKLADLDKEISIVMSKVSDLKKKKEQALAISTKISQLNDKKAPLDFNSELATLKEKILSVQSNYLVREKELDDLRERRDSIKKSLLEAETSLKAVLEIKMLETEIVNIESELSKFRVSQSEYESSSKYINQLRLSLKDLENQIELLKAKQHEKIELLSSVRMRIEEQKAIVSEAASLETSAVQLNVFKQCLELAQVELRSMVIEALNLKMSMLWKSLYPYSDINSIRLVVQESGYSFEAQKSSWVDASALSGGERSCLAIVFRLALSNILMPKLNAFFMDEPTHNLDAEAVRSLAILFEEKIPLLVDQAIIITHDTQLIREGYASLIMLERDKTKDGFTIVNSQ